MYCFLASPPVYPPNVVAEPVHTSQPQASVRMVPPRDRGLNAIPVFEEDSAHCTDTSRGGLLQSRAAGDAVANADACWETSCGVDEGCAGVASGGGGGGASKKGMNLNLKDTDGYFGPELVATIVKFKHVVKKEGEMDLEEMAWRYGSQEGELLGPVVTATVACCIWNMASFALMVYLFWKAHMEQRTDSGNKVPWGLLGTIPLAAIGALLCWAVRVEWKKLANGRHDLRNSEAIAANARSATTDSTILEMGPVR